jgi:hypothetical protein
VHDCQHILQVYGSDEILLDALEDYVAAGLRNEEAVIVIATRSHRSELERRLARAGHDLARAFANEQLLLLSAAATLERFMVDGHPDEALFLSTIRPVIERARGAGRVVRGFGEMVALLWARGNHEATVELEILWNQLLRVEDVRLFCAYPAPIFTPRVSGRVHAIRAAHTHLFEG